MKLLLISDTHGHLDQIKTLAASTRCDAVIHAGDLGFYDAQSPSRLSERELNLRIIHSDLPDNEKREMLSLSPEKKILFVRDRLPLSQLPHYLTGERRFSVPVYAVWGNHEDVEVVKKFYSGDYEVPNLRLLHEKSAFRVDGCHLFGIGGNLLLGRKLFQKPIAGGGGKVWTVLSQYLDLIDSVTNKEAEGEVRILVSHVSPGKEALVSLVGACMGASLIISGHMGPPFVMCWNEFAIRDPEESMRRLEQCVADVCTQAEQFDQTAKNCASKLRDCLVRSQRETIPVGRGATAPRWYRDITCINLTDCKEGYAVLTVEDRSMRLETCTIRGRGEGCRDTTEQGDARLRAPDPRCFVLWRGSGSTPSRGNEVNK